MGKDRDPEIRSLDELGEAVGGVEPEDGHGASLSDLNEWIEDVFSGAWIHPDSAGETEIDVCVGNSGYTLEYPFALSRFWIAFWDLAWMSVAKEIELIEGFPVVTMGLSPGDWDWRTQPLPDHYPYKRATPGSTTVAGWLRQRFRRHYGAYDVGVLRPDGSVAPGQLRLSTLRQLWNDSGWM